MHGLTQLPDLLLNLFHLLCGELILVGRVVLVQLQQLDHELEAGPVQIHVKTIPTQNVHQGGRAQTKVLTEQDRTAFLSGTEQAEVRQGGQRLEVCTQHLKALT